MGDWWNQPMRRAAPGPEPDGSESSSAATGSATCPWCSATAEPVANHCPSCGAVMAQRESLGGIVIPGVTDVDPGMRRPPLTGSRLGSQARMNMLGAMGQAAGPSAQIVTAAAILAKDSIGGTFRPAMNPDQVGRPSQAAIDMAGRLSTPRPSAAGPADSTVVAVATDAASDEPALEEAPPDEPA